jgi:hypothetical protein
MSSTEATRPACSRKSALRGMRWPIKRSVKKEPPRERIFHAASAGNQDDLRFKTVHGKWHFRFVSTLL